MDLNLAKQLVAESGEKLLHEGLTARTWGNLSCRVDQNTMVITPSGLGYDGMTADDIVKMDMNTGEWEGDLKPSSEKRVHIAAYRQFPEVGFVIHTHQIYASAFCVAGFDELVITAKEKEALGGLALANYALPSTKMLFKSVANTFSTGAHVVLMENHGAVITGKDAEEAFARAQLVEAICQRNFKGHLLPEPPFDQPLADSLIAEAKKAFDDFVVYSATPATLTCAANGQPIPAQLDDMAQMIGPKLAVIAANPADVIKALAKRDVILVPNVGAICRAKTQGDVDALCMLAEKSCTSYLHSLALGVRGRLSRIDTILMRVVYLQKYSKQIGG